MNDMQEIIETVRVRLFDKFYSKDLKPTKKEIESWVNKTIEFLEKRIDVEQKSEIVQNLFNDSNKETSGYEVITNEKSKPWIHTRANEEGVDQFSRLYRQHLLKQGKIPSVSIHEIFDESDYILDLLANPLSDSNFKKKGLVIGNVQSGKTANYLGLINRAADFGYKLIILLSGIHNNLRRQTQMRVNEGFVGYDPLLKKKMGVGLLEGYRNIPQPVSFTNCESDFDKHLSQTINFNPNISNSPVILVLKKNYHTLNSVINWLEVDSDRGIYRNSYPLLLIDDEADNASVNYKDENDSPTTINGQIRQILGLFDKSAYVGYTATPFANIFINPNSSDNFEHDDLFPEDFIVSLNPPPNYVGPKQFFLDDSEQYISKVLDNEQCIPVKPDRDWSIQCIPNTLKRAVEHFLLTIAIKECRNTSQVHTSMLINISHKVSLQTATYEIVSEYLDSIKRVIRFEYLKGYEYLKNKKELKHLHDIWVNDFNEEGDFVDLLTTIVSKDRSIKTYLINSESTDELDYDLYPQGLHVIAIGGYSLSRGFTLEGLTTSYILRNSKMSDTILQMGRWFGYRDGYADICRIFITPKSFVWYSHIAEVIEELKNEIKILRRHKLTPKEYGLKIRNHPGALEITAKNKMRSGQSVVVSADFSATLFQSSVLSAKTNTIHKNTETLNNWIKSLGDFEKTDSGYLWKNISNKSVSQFISDFEMHDSYIGGKLVGDYIKSGKSEELESWDVYLPDAGEEQEYSINSNIFVKKQRRTFTSIEGNIISFEGGGGRVVRFFDEEVGLSKEELEWAKEAQNQAGVKETARYYREYRSKPLLVLKLFTVKLKSGEVVADVIPAYGISFPKNKKHRSVEYTVNKTWIKNNFEE
jgi:hypothetical protein